MADDGGEIRLSPSKTNHLRQEHFCVRRRSNGGDFCGECVLGRPCSLK